MLNYLLLPFILWCFDEGLVYIFLSSNLAVALVTTLSLRWDVGCGM